MQCGPCHDYRAFRLTNVETPVADGSVVEQMRSPSPVLRQSFASPSPVLRHTGSATLRQQEGRGERTWR
jgi:hypothetical protein